MKSFVYTALVGSITAIQLQNQWPSVARCKPGQISTDFEACDHNNKGEFQHDKIPPS